MRRTHRQGRDGAVEDVGARLHRFQVGHRSHPRRVVGVHVHENIGIGLLEGAHQLVGVVGIEKPGHVFDADALDPHLHQPSGILQERGYAVHGTLGVADGPLRPLAVGQHRGDGLRHVAWVVEGIEHPEHVDACLRRQPHELPQHIVGVVAVAHHVLAAKEHLQPRVGHGGFECTHPLPGIFVEKAHHGVERSSTPHLERPVARPVELLGYGQHVFGTHAGR